MNEKKLIVLLSVILICCVSAMLYLMTNQPPAATSVSKAPKIIKTASTVGGPFSMTDHNGNAVTEADYDGQYKMIFFGFTHCPGICPGELQKFATILDILAENGEDKKITPLFVTIDPERDGVEEMKEYVELFDDRIIGLTGTREQVNVMKDNYKVHASKVEMEMMDPGEYMMDHSTFTYLMSPDNELLLVFDLKDKPESVAEEIRSVL